MIMPIGLLRFQNPAGEMIGVECSDISLIEPCEGIYTKSRVVLRNGQDRRSCESASLLMDRYDEITKLR